MDQGNCSCEGCFCLHNMLRDGGITLYATHEQFNEKMKQTAQKLNLRSHLCGYTYYTQFYFILLSVHR